MFVGGFYVGELWLYMVFDFFIFFFIQGRGGCCSLGEELVEEFLEGSESFMFWKNVVLG
jgi:hypothetical protein